MGTSGKTQKREYLDKPTLYATIPTNAGGNFGLAGLAVLAPGARAQTGEARRPFRVGIPFRQTLEWRAQLAAVFALHGWKEGRDYVVLAEDHEYGERLEEGVRAVLAKRPDLIYVASTAYALAAYRLTKTVPIVVFGSGYPVEVGLAESLARPGRNVTGNTVFSGVGIWGKLAQLVLEAKPGTRRVGVLWTYVPPLFPVEGVAPLVLELAHASRQLGVTLHRVDVAHPRAIGDALAALSAWGAEALLLTYGPAFALRRQDVLAYAAERRWPTVIDFDPPPEEKGRRPLITYAPSWDDLRRQAFDYMVRILRDGAKPGDLPIQQATTLELVINMKTAKALGLTIPQSVLLRADRVIE